MNVSKSVASNFPDFRDFDVEPPPTDCYPPRMTQTADLTSHTPTAAVAPDPDKTGAASNDTPKPRRSLASLRMIWDRARRYPAQIAAAATALLIAASATMMLPIGFMSIIDAGFGSGGAGAAKAMTGTTPGAAILTDTINRIVPALFGGAPGDIGPYFRFLFVVIMVLACATAVRFYFVSWLGERVVADVRMDVQANMLRMHPSFFEENRPSEIASRMTSDTAIIEQIVGTTVSVALRNIVMAILGTGLLILLAPKLTLIVLLGIVVVVVPIMLLGRRLEKLSRSSQDRVADVGAMTSEVLGAMKIVQAFGQEPREQQRFASAVTASFATARQRIRLRAVMTAVVMALIFGAITLMMWYGAEAVRAGEITGGTIAAFVMTGVLIAGAFGALTEVLGDLVRGAGAASRLSELMREEPAIAAPAQPVAMPVPPRGEIRFDHVTFRYPTRPEVSALEDFSLTIAPRETVAVVGPSGAGKSTLFQLLQRFYDPEGGSVSIDGVRIDQADPAEVRRRTAMVPQETVIFAASARDNLRYGAWDADDAAIWRAAEAANAADFLRALPEGLDTFMGEGGARLSGGQRQRLAIARALLRDAPILLLDEATSALDAESERLVQDALGKLMQDRTTLVIAHRLATIREATRIIVMDKGRIVESGTHDTLVERDGLYARLARLQFQDGGLNDRD